MFSDRHICKAASLGSSEAQVFLIVFSRKLHFRATFKEGEKNRKIALRRILIYSSFCCLCVQG